MALLVKHLLSEQQVVGLIPSWVIPKTSLKLLLVALSLWFGIRKKCQDWLHRCQYNVTDDVSRFWE